MQSDAGKVQADLGEANSRKNAHGLDRGEGDALASPVACSCGPRSVQASRPGPSAKPTATPAYV